MLIFHGRPLVIVWAVLMAIIVVVPIWHGYHQARNGYQFMGVVGPYHNDFNSYLAWMRQAYDGNLLFKDKYTTEPHRRVFFHPLFWLIGTTARLSGASLMAVCYVVQLMGLALMIFGIYRFSAFFTGDVWTRFLALVLATTASGFGWMTTVPNNTPVLQLPIDLWLNAANGFQATVTSFFTLPIALGLMMWSASWFLRYLDSGRLRASIVSGLFALALTATHQYDIVTLYAVLGVWTVMTARLHLMEAFKQPVTTLGQPPFAGMLVVLAISIPFALYSLAIVKFNPVLSRVGWSMPLPAFRLFVIGWGLPLLLCIVGLALPSVWRGNRRVGLLLGWLLINIILLFLPIEFKRKLIWGIHVPMCLLAAMAVMTGLRAATRPLSRSTARLSIIVVATVVVVMFSAIGSGLFYARLFERNTLRVFGDYLPDSYFDAMRWLDNNSNDGEVVIAGPAIANMIPGRTGNTVFEGHWAQTLDLRRKRQFIRLLFNPHGLADINVIRRVFLRNRVRYILLDTATARRGGLPFSTSRFPFIPLVEPVFQNDSVLIWEIKDYRSGLETQSWPNGNWFGSGEEDLNTFLADQIKLNEAYDKIQKTLELYPKDPILYLKLGNLYAGIGQYGLSLGQYKKALSIQPDNASIYYNIACIYARGNRVKESIGWLKKAINKGFNKIDLIKTDKDLNAIRDSREYRELIKSD